MAQPLEVLVVVDLYGEQPLDEIAKVLPQHGHERRTLRATEFGAAKLQKRTDSTALPWTEIAEAVEALAAQVRTLAAGRETAIFVAGQGPLAVFVHLGYAISRFVGTAHSVIVRPPGGAVTLYPVTGGSAEQSSILTVREGWRSTPCPASGHVALYIDTGGRPPLDDAMRTLVGMRNDGLAEIVELRTGTSTIVTAEQSAAVATEFVTELARLPSMYPHTGAIELFVAVPTFLAYAVGLSLNSSIFKQVQLTEFYGNQYEDAYALPFKPRKAAALSKADADVLARRAVSDVLARAFTDLQRHVEPTDVDFFFFEPEVAEDFVRKLRALKLGPPEGEAFDLSVAHGHVRLGEGLLEALRNGEDERNETFLKLVLLHELLHDFQGIRTTNFAEIGRAGVVLEEIDFTADLFSLRALARCIFRRGHETAAEKAREIAVRLMEASLYGVERFDLMEHGVKIERLAERRLRRYLIWHLQLARAGTVKTPDHVERLLKSVLRVELAPLRGALDARHDKIVVDAMPHTELFASVDARLIRHVKNPSFSPGALVEAVRTFTRTALQKEMLYVLGENRRVLAPWADE